jgi:hypothetical protein
LALPEPSIGCKRLKHQSAVKTNQYGFESAGWTTSGRLGTAPAMGIMERDCGISPINQYRKEPKMAGKNFKVAYGVDQRVKEDNDRIQLQMEQLVHESLCSNCRHQGDCAFLSKACTPILNCELYECGLSEKPRLMVVKKTCAASEGQPESDDALLGLCINCENLRGCNLPKSLGGVWMCEEYR